MDTPPPSSASRPAGFATIALASAAGVIVASRMGRPALALAAGLALAWWKKHQQTRRPVQAQTQTPQYGGQPPVMSTPPAEAVVAEAAPAPASLAPVTAFVAPGAFAAPPAEPVYNDQVAETEPASEPEAFVAFEPPAPTLAMVTYEAPTVPAYEVPQESTPILEIPAQAEPGFSSVASFDQSLPEPDMVEPEPPPPAFLVSQLPEVTASDEIGPAPPMAFPVAPLRTEAPLADAWNDLRAALSPSLLGKGPKSEPLPPMPSPDEPPAAKPVTPLARIEAPEMPEMYVFPPSSPLLDTLDEDEPLPAYSDASAEDPTIPLTCGPASMPEMPEMDVFPASSPLIGSTEALEAEAPLQPHHPPAPAYDSLHYIPQPSTEPVGDIPDEVHLPGMTEEETAAAMAESGFLVTDPEVAPEPTAPQFLHAFAPPAIVSHVPPTNEEKGEAINPEASKPLTAPVIVPREVQAKKSFFDWLRS